MEEKDAEEDHGKARFLAEVSKLWPMARGSLSYVRKPCIQHCYAHLLRDVHDLEKEFPDGPEVSSFVETFAPLLSQAMSLRGLPIPDRQFYGCAKVTKQTIVEAVERSAHHPGIQRI